MYCGETNAARGEKQNSGICIHVGGYIIGSIATKKQQHEYEPTVGVWLSLILVWTHLSQKYEVPSQLHPKK